MSVCMTEFGTKEEAITSSDIETENSGDGNME